MKFIIDRAKYIDTGLVNKQFHPTFPLVIYNYSQLTQFSKAWDDVTLMCRGLIVNKDTHEIVARPFKKFFNYEEHLANGMPVPSEMPMIYKKLDGSLGILYSWEGKQYIATRGSFTSDQAIWATEWVQKNIPNLHVDGLTLLWEIIYPQNRIVVNYNFSGLVLIGAVHNETGRTAAFLESMVPDVKIAENVPYTSYSELKALNTPNEEGFVAHFPHTDVRVKIKFEDYVRLHKIMTGLSEIGIWEMLRDGKDPITPEIPDEMHGWISGVVNDLRAKFAGIWGDAQLTVQLVQGKATRKEQAMEIMQHHKHISGVAFSILDKKEASAVKTVWQMVRPKGSHVYKKDIDA